MDHGKTVFITPGEKRIISLLSYSMFAGIPSAFVLVIVLHAVGVRAIPNVPIRGERREEQR